MSFLAPLFLLGLAGWFVPWLLHRFNDIDAPSYEFPSDQLLEPATIPPSESRLTRYRLLLALRWLLLAALCIWFARPLLPWADQHRAEARSAHWIVLDASASMQAGNVWPEALDKLDQLQGQLDDDAVRVYRAGAVLTLLADNRQSDLPAAPVDSPQPGLARVAVGQVLRQLSLLAAESTLPVTIHWISDLQQSGFGNAVPAAFGHLAAIEYHQVGDGAKPNIALQSRGSVLSTQLSGATSGYRIDVDVVGRGLPDEPEKPIRAEVQLLRKGEIRQTRQVSLVGDSSVTVQFESSSTDNEAPGNQGDPPDSLQLLVQDSRMDALEADNRQDIASASSFRWALPLVFAQPGRISLVPSSLTEQSAELYLSTALAQNLNVPLLQRLPRTLDKSLAPMLVMVDSRVPTGARLPSLPDAIEQYLADGGNVLAVFNRSDSLSPVAGDQPDRVVLQRSYHPLAANRQQWNSVQLYRVYRPAPGKSQQVLIETENQVPVLIEDRSSQGRLLWLTTPLDGRSNNLPISPAFVSLIESAVEYLSQQQVWPSTLVVGEVLHLPPTTQLVDGLGEPLLSVRDSSRGTSYRFVRPGVYSIVEPGGEYPLTINIDPRESDFRTLPATEIERWQAVVGSGGEDGADATTPDEPANEPGLWHWLLLALLGVAASEAMLANRYLWVRRGV